MNNETRIYLCTICGSRITYYVEDLIRRRMCTECMMREHFHSRFTEPDTDVAKCGIPDCGKLARYWISTSTFGFSYDLSPYYYCQDCRDAAPHYVQKYYHTFDPYEWI